MVERARIVLLAAAGKKNKEIAERLGVNAQEASRWRARFLEQGVGGLDKDAPRLGDRVFNLLDDLSRWGFRKRVLGEVDVFQFDETHELYGHMNINYVKAERLPDFDRYGEILEPLLAGDFFVSTGEVLLPEWKIATSATGGLSVAADVKWTFPLRFAEIVWGDGEAVHRERFDLGETRPFDERTFSWSVPGARDWKWARVAVWDVAANGAFVNPTWR